MAAVLLLAGCSGTVATTTAATGSTAQASTATTAVTSSPGQTSTAATTAPASSTAQPSTQPAPSGTAAPTGTQATQPARPRETTLNLELEGMKEQVAATLFTSTLGYTLYLENNRFQIGTVKSRFAESATADRLTSIPIVKDLPEMYLEIGRLPAITREDALKRMLEVLKQQYPGVRQSDPIGVGAVKSDALTLRAVNGTATNSEAVQGAVFSDGKGGVYYYLIAYFFGASQGMPSRYNQYLDTFRMT